MVENHNNHQCTSLPCRRPAERTCAHPSELVCEALRLKEEKKGEKNYKLLEGKLTLSAWAVNLKSSFLLSTDGYLGLLYSDWSRKPVPLS